MAVDWIDKNIYWVDAVERVIKIGSLNDTSRQKTLIAEHLEHPTAIAVSPLQRRIYFCDAGRSPKIEVANLDGSQRKLITNTNLIWPTDISIDEPNERLYFADYKTKRIETLNLRLIDRRLVRAFAFDEDPPIKLDVFEDQLYFSTAKHRLIHRMHKFGNFTSNGAKLMSAKETLVETSTGSIPTAILIVQEQKQPKGIIHEIETFKSSKNLKIPTAILIVQEQKQPKGIYYS